jgi:polyhydroxyalkanoate synthesis regulator phasin
MDDELTRLAEEYAKGVTEELVKRGVVKEEDAREFLASLARKVITRVKAECGEALNYEIPA